MVDKPLDIQDDDTHVTEESGDAVKAIARQGDGDRPYCRVHFTLMRASSTKGRVTRYKCPVPGCSEKEKRARGTSRIPREPLECPRCRQRQIEEGKKNPRPVYCEADYHGSHAGMIKMACKVDACGFYVFLPKPGIARIRRRMSDSETTATR